MPAVFFSEVLQFAPDRSDGFLPADGHQLTSLSFERLHNALL
jgi:hypothetical protein